MAVCGVCAMGVIKCAGDKSIPPRGVALPAPGSLAHAVCGGLWQFAVHHGHYQVHRGQKRTARKILILPKHLTCTVFASSRACKRFKV